MLNNWTGKDTRGAVGLALLVAITAPMNSERVFDAYASVFNTAVSFLPDQETIQKNVEQLDSPFLD